MNANRLTEQLENKTIRCRCCNHRCTIQDGKTGICGVRRNNQGTMQLLVYGRTAAVNIDPVEKKPFYHFLPGSRIFSIGTVGCNFSCKFCQNWEISQISKKADGMHDIMQIGHELMPTEIIELCKKHDVEGLAYTYNEPTIFYEYMEDTATKAESLGIKNLMVTNGYITKEGLERIKDIIHGMNIDLKSMRKEFYRKICGAKLEPVLNTIKAAHRYGIWIEITTLLIPGENDSKEEIRKTAKFIKSIDRKIPWHITAFRPDYKMLEKKATNSTSLADAHKIGFEEGLEYVYVGNITTEKRSNTYCPECKELLIERKGFKANIKGLEQGKCKKCKARIAGVWK